MCIEIPFYAEKNVQHILPNFTNEIYARIAKS